MLYLVVMRLLRRVCYLNGMFEEEHQSCGSSTTIVEDIEQPLNSEPSRSVYGSLNRGSRNVFGGKMEVKNTIVRK